MVKLFNLWQIKIQFIKILNEGMLSLHLSYYNVELLFFKIIYYLTNIETDTILLILGINIMNDNSLTRLVSIVFLQLTSSTIPALLQTMSNFPNLATVC